MTRPSSERGSGYAKARTKRGKSQGEVLALLGVRSPIEGDVLDDLRERGVHAEYETDTVPYLVPAKARKYTPDIPFHTAAGYRRYAEVKGYLSVEDKKKLELVKEQHPDLWIGIVFEDPWNLFDDYQKKLSQFRKSLGVPSLTRGEKLEWRRANFGPRACVFYWEWAEKLGFPWAEQRVPASWITDDEGDEGDAGE